MWGPLNTQRNKLDVRVGERRRVKCAVEQGDFAAAFDVNSEIRRWKRTFAAEQRQAAAGAQRDSQKLPGLKQGLRHFCSRFSVLFQVSAV